MDELEHLRRMRSDLPGPDRESYEAAKAALDSAVDAERVGSQRRRFRWKGVSLAAGAMAVAVAVTLALISESEDPTAESPPLASLFGGDGDYEPAESPAQLAKQLETDPGVESHLVAQGTITGFEPGRIYGKSLRDPEAVPTVVMEFQADTMLRGELPPGSNGTVFVEFFGEPERATQLQRRLPEGTPALAYLFELSPEGVFGKGAAISQNTAGRDPGQPLFGMFSPQGFYIDDPKAEAVVQPQESLVFPGASLDDFEPGVGDEFPEGRLAPGL